MPAEYVKKLFFINKIINVLYVRLVVLYQTTIWLSLKGLSASPTLLFSLQTDILAHDKRRDLFY